MKSTLYYYVGIILVGSVFAVTMFLSMPSDTWVDHRWEFVGVASPDELDERIDCLSKGGVWDYVTCDFDGEPKSKMQECWQLFHCNVENKNFLGCINAKKNGDTIDDICSNSDITINDGCATIVFPDGTKTVSCHYED